MPLPRDALHPGDQHRTASNLDCILCQSPGCYMICGTATTEALTEMSRVVSSQFQSQRSINCGMAPPFPTRLEYSQLVHWYNAAKIRGKPPPVTIDKISTTLGVTRKEVSNWFTAERRIRGHLPAGPQRSTHSPTPSADGLGQIRVQLPLDTGARVSQGKSDSGDEYIEEGDVEVKSDTDPLMAAATYGLPFSQWDRAPMHPIIDTSPLHQFEASDIGTPDAKEDVWNTMGIPQPSPVSQTTRHPHIAWARRSRDPWTSSRSTTTSSAEHLRDPDDPRSMGTGAPQNRMETSDSDSADGSISYVP